MKKTQEIKDNLLRKLLATQDLGTTGIERILKGETDAEADPLSAIIVNAVDQNESEGEIYDNLDYAIQMLQRAQKALNTAEEVEQGESYPNYTDSDDFDADDKAFL
jgi:hypothetical protein